MNMTKEKIWSFFSNLEQPYKCSAGSKMVNIDSDGTIYPCQILIQKTSEKENILGNLNDFKIEDFQENREKFLNKNIKSGECLDCISYYSCSTCLGVDNYKKDCR